MLYFVHHSLQFDPAPRAGEPLVSRRVPDVRLIAASSATQADSKRWTSTVFLVVIAKPSNSILNLHSPHFGGRVYVIWAVRSILHVHVIGFCIESRHLRRSMFAVQIVKQRATKQAVPQDWQRQCQYKRVMPNNALRRVRSMLNCDLVESISRSLLS